MTDDNQDQPGLPVPTDAGEINNELEGLQEEMADTRGPYWSGPRAERKQARYRQLVEAQERLEAGADGPGEVEPVAMGDQDVSTALGNLDAMGEVGQAWADELRRGGAQSALEHGEQVRLEILADLGSAADEVAQAFDGLDDNVRGAVYRELASAYVPRLPPAEASDVKAFEQTSAGEILASEWSADTPQRLAIVLHRWERLTADLTDDEFAELDDFYRVRLRPVERAAILRRLAA